MPDDLRERIADLRRLRREDPQHYELRAANFAPALADAYDAAQATIAERDAEIARLKEALWDLAGIDLPEIRAKVEQIAGPADALKGANRDE